MTDFPIHTPESARAGSKALLEATQKRVGWIANVYGALAEAPIVLEAYDMLGTLLRRASFTPTERHVVWFTINAYHDCHYCMAAHTLLAKAEKVPEAVIGTARAMGSYDDPKLEALRVLPSTWSTAVASRHRRARRHSSPPGSPGRTCSKSSPSSPTRFSRTTPTTSSSRRSTRHSRRLSGPNRYRLAVEERITPSFIARSTPRVIRLQIPNGTPPATGRAIPVT
jgi:alkylhydroperoxidase family enzyme